MLYAYYRNIAHITSSYHNRFLIFATLGSIINITVSTDAFVNIFQDRCGLQSADGIRRRHPFDTFALSKCSLPMGTLLRLYTPPRTSPVIIFIFFTIESTFFLLYSALFVNCCRRPLANINASLLSYSNDAQYFRNCVCFFSRGYIYCTFQLYLRRTIFSHMEIQKGTCGSSLVQCTNGGMPSWAASIKCQILTARFDTTCHHISLSGKCFPMLLCTCNLRKFKSPGTSLLYSILIFVRPRST